jgi:hypothetical protein
MPRRLRTGLIVLALLSTTAQVRAEDAPAIKNGDMLTGKLRLVQTRHPNGWPIKAYQIVSTPRKMPAADDFCTYDGPGATTFHLFTMAKGATSQLQPLLGKTITVRADSLFCSETAWHIGDVVVPQWTLVK